MSEELSPKPDLASLGMDLARSFQPSWVNDPPVSKELTKMAERFDREPAREGRGTRDGRGGGNFRPQNREARGEKRPSDRDRRDGGGKSKSGGKDRSDRRDRKGRDDRPARPEPVAKPVVLQGWEVRFISDPRGIDGLIRQVKTLARAYPLFDLARLILDRAERYSVEFKALTDGMLYQYRGDETLWTSPSEAIAHALSKDLAKYYVSERVKIAEPKGSFAFIAECDGVLLGPPNHHDYQSRLRKLHAERFSRMPFEAFKNRIRMLKDEDTLQKWKDEQSFREEFMPVTPGAEKEISTETVDEPASDAVLPEAATEIVAEISAETLTEAETSTEPVIEPVTETVVEEVSEVSKETTLRLVSMDEVSAHFLATFAPTEILVRTGTFQVSGPAAIRHSAPPVLALVREANDALMKFPLPLAHELGQAFNAAGLQIFKGRDNITYVSVARPKPLDRSQNLADGVRAILDYLEANPKVPRPEQWKALIAQRPLPEGADEKARESSVLADLSWLLHEGHVIDFANRGLEVVKPKPVERPAAG